MTRAQARVNSSAKCMRVVFHNVSYIMCLLYECSPLLYMFDEEFNSNDVYVERSRVAHHRYSALIIFNL